MNKVSKEQWLAGQEIERAHHDEINKENGYQHYKESYEQYFKHVEIDKDVGEKIIAEIGPADYPALLYCKNQGVSVIVEPMPSKTLEDICKENGFILEKELAEDAELPICDEIWLFNVLQHVMDPDKIIDRCKEASDIIRFFEPINAGTGPEHHHEFDLDYFRKHFGDCVKHYPKNNEAINFHRWECAYGVWKRNEEDN